jgi:predicted nucleotide-binding protein
MAIDRSAGSLAASAGENTTGASAPGIAPRVEEADRRKVFVVHGRNDKARRALFSFLRALHLEPIEWGHAVTLTGQSSPYIGDVLDAVFRRAQAVVVLLTGDDVARLRSGFVGPDDPAYERSSSPQPRPNVLFEAGMAFGRNPDRTILVQLGDVRPFSDVAGRHIVKLADDVASRQDLAVRLQAAGCAVDISGRDWHTEGDFDSCLWLVPLPRDLAIVPPTLHVPDSLARYSGRWEGVWDDMIQHELVVQKITPLGAEVIYAVGDSKPWNITRSFARRTGSFDEHAVLHLQLPRERGEARVAYRPTPDFSELHASFEYAGLTFHAVMKRVPVV